MLKRIINVFSRQNKTEEEAERKVIEEDRRKVQEAVSEAMETVMLTAQAEARLRKKLDD